MKYIKIPQRPYCCVGVCLEMILRRHDIKEYGQEEIATDLGLVVPAHLASLFPHARFAEKPSAGYGTQIQNPEFSINNFFKKHGINLKEAYSYITDLSQARELLETADHQDVMIIFHCGTLYNDPEKDWGHAVLFDHLEGDQVVLQENSENRNLETVEFEDLLQAIKYHGLKNGAGFYVIESKVENNV